MKKLYLVDVSSMFFRAFFALPHMSNDKGMPTNALYGFLSMTVKLLREVRPDYMVFCFDRKEPSFRSAIYPEYKANREEMPNDLIPQIPFVRTLTETLGIAAMDRETFEADDVIGSLARWGREQGLEVFIVSGDKDFAQLIGPHVTMYDTMKDVKYDPAGVAEKWGVHPTQMIDYLALVGDASDNIPGVRGIGPKGAQKLLAEYATLDGVYENLGKITGKAMKANLEASKELAFLSRELVTIRQDVELGVPLEDFKLREIDRDKLRALLQELRFKTFEKNLLGAPDASASESAPTVAAPAADGQMEMPAVAVRKVRRPSKSTGAIQEIRWSLKELETELPPYSDVWAILNERGFYLGFENKVLLVDAPPEDLGRVLSRKHLKWHGFDLKEAWRYLQCNECVATWDSMLAAYVLRAGQIENFAETYEAYCGGPVPDLATPAQWYEIYLELRDCLKAKLEEVKGEKVLEELELPLVGVLYQMEKYGIAVDVQELSEQSKLLESDVKGLEKQIFAAAGCSFNISSPKQLAQILFSQMKLTPGRKTKTGYSTDSDVLEKLKTEHLIAQLLIDYRELTKLKSTYVDALPMLVNAKTKRLHTNMRQASTSTGRLSSINPNLQNIPIRSARGRLVRKAFVAGPGLSLIAADYSQIELRILAHISCDEGLCSAFEADLDIHAATASEVFGVGLSDVTTELRRTAKAVNFGIAYGQGAFGLAEGLGIGRTEAADIIDRYFKRFSKVKQYMEEVVETAKKNGFVETLFGRRRYLDELNSKNGAMRKFGERAAINAPIQGTASDIVKLAMIKLHEEVSIPMLLQVHDELIFETPDADIEEHAPMIKKIMETVVKLKVPLRVNVASGPNWDAAHS